MHEFRIIKEHKKRDNNKKMKAVILAGGLGTRLRPVFPTLPKALAPAAGKPFLAYQIENLAAQGFNDLVL